MKIFFYTNCNHFLRHRPHTYPQPPDHSSALPSTPNRPPSPSEREGLGWGVVKKLRTVGLENEGINLVNHLKFKNQKD